MMNKERISMRAGEHTHPGSDVDVGAEGDGTGSAVLAEPLTALFPTAEVAASEDFLATYGEDTTDLLEMGAQESVDERTDRRQFILTVVAGPHTGFAKVIDQGAQGATSAEVVIGRAGTSDLILVDPGLSRRHCRIFAAPNGMMIEDLGSSNGTFVDGEAVYTPQALHEGARIHLGRHTLLTLSRQDPLEYEAARQLFETSMRDPLTDLYNRRFFDRRLHEEFAYAARHQTPLSIIVLDLDHFKRVNDTWGHPAGDEVLREVGALVRSCFRQEDVAFRLGGEEFAILVRGQTHTGARAAAERVRRVLADAVVPWEDQTIRFTASVGVATGMPGDTAESASALLNAADRALYRAKSGGRNRCEG
jgi:two-component system cell cycle response regulator